MTLAILDPGLSLSLRLAAGRPPEALTPAPAAPPGSTADSPLEARALAGDPQAWNALIQRHNHRVVVSLLARGVRLDRANDLAQDAWLRLIEQQRLGKLVRLTLPGLAVAQAAFLALEDVRRVRRAERPDDAEAAAAMVDPSANAESRLLTSEKLARIGAVLSQCSPSSRRVFGLVYDGGGRSHAEVAALVGLSVQRVRQIVCEVRQQLRRALDAGVDGT